MFCFTKKFMVPTRLDSNERTLNKQMYAHEHFLLADFRENALDSTGAHRLFEFIAAVCECRLSKGTLIEQLHRTW